VFIVAGKIFKRFSIKFLITFSLAVTAIRWFILALYGENIYLLSFSQLIHAASFGLYHSASMQFIHQHFDSNQQSRGQAIYIGGVYGVGGAIGAYISGVLWLDGSGSQFTFLVAAGFAGIGAITSLYLPKSNGKVSY